MSYKKIINIVTLVLVLAIIYFAWDSIISAFGLIGSINLWIFCLIIPTQLVSFAAIGQVMISYLKQKGETIKIPWLSRARLALELNFVDQIVPVPSLAGMTYFSWRMKSHGISSSRSTIAYIIRIAASFCCFALAVIVSVLVLMFDHMINRDMLFLSAMMVVVVFICLVLLIFIANNTSRLVRFSVFSARTINKISNKITFGRSNNLISTDKVKRFLIDLHDDYIEIKKDKRILIKPFLWAVLDCVFDVLLVFIAFWSLGTIINPAVLFIVYGVCSMVGIIAATPGGVGAVETLMIALYVSTGLSPEEAIAGTLLARVTLFSGTIIFGYLFYQLTINKYGKVTK